MGKLPALNTKNLPVLLPPVQSKYISQVPFTCAFIGRVKSGKTYAAVSLANLLKKEGSITHIYIISPTLKSNPLFSILNPNQTFQDADSVFESLTEVQNTVERLADSFEADLRYARARKLFVEGGSLSGTQESLLESKGFQEIDLQEKRPKPLLIIDDCSHSKLFSTGRKNPLTNLVLRHRHLGRGIGLSIMLIAQTFRSGVPRALRQNLSHVGFFHTEDLRERKAVHEETGGLLSYDDFNIVFEAFTEERHSFLWLDLVDGRLLRTFMPSKK